MSVRSRINELIDSKNIEDAQKTVEIRFSEISTADLQSVYFLTQKLIENKQSADAISVLFHLRRSSVFLSTSDFCSLLKGLLRVGTIHQCKSLLSSFIEEKVIIETQAPLVFIETASEKTDFDSAFDIISALDKRKVPLNERFWESAISALCKNDAVVHASSCFNLITMPALKSKRIWGEFITACIRSHNFQIALETVEKIGLVSDKSLMAEWWNLLLKTIVDDSEMPCFEICKILNKVVEIGLVLNGDAFSQSLIRLVLGREEGKIVGYLKNLKNSVTSFVTSRLITKLIDMNLPREALEISNLVVQEAFGPQVTVDNLEIANDKLKWILKHQQLQMIKFMKMKKNLEVHNPPSEIQEELDDEEFVFL